MTTDDRDTFHTCVTTRQRVVTPTPTQACGPIAVVAGAEGRVNPFHFLEAQIDPYGAANGENLVDPQGKWNWLEQMGNAYIKSQQQEQSSVPVLTGDRPLSPQPGGWLLHGVWL